MTQVYLQVSWLFPQEVKIGSIFSSLLQSVIWKIVDVGIDTCWIYVICTRGFDHKALVKVKKILVNLYMSWGSCRWLHLFIISNVTGLLDPLITIKLLFHVIIVILEYCHEKGTSRGYLLFHVIIVSFLFFFYCCSKYFKKISYRYQKLTQMTKRTSIVLLYLSILSLFSLSSPHLCFSCYPNTKYLSTCAHFNMWPLAVYIKCNKRINDNFIILPVF